MELKYEFVLYLHEITNSSFDIISEAITQKC